MRLRNHFKVPAAKQKNVLGGLISKDCQNTGNLSVFTIIISYTENAHDVFKDYNFADEIIDLFLTESIVISHPTEKVRHIDLGYTDTIFQDGDAFYQFFIVLLFNNGILNSDDIIMII